MPNGTSILLGFALVLTLTWFWYGRGLHERALKAVRRYCIQQGLILLDDTVVLHQLMLWPNSQGKKRLLARRYHFDFTLNGLQRHQGTLILVGAQVLRIETPAYLTALELEPEPVIEPIKPEQHLAPVIQLAEWRRLHPKPAKNREHSHS